MTMFSIIVITIKSQKIVNISTSIHSTAKLLPSLKYTEQYISNDVRIKTISSMTLHCYDNF